MNPWPTIFLCGMPRSGTTWLGKIFDSHPATQYLHEPDSEYRLHELPLYPELERLPRWQPMLQAFYDALPALRSSKILGKTPLFPKHYLSPFKQQILRANIYLSKLSSRAAINVPIVNLDARHNRKTLVWKSIESVGRFGIIMQSIDASTFPFKGILILRHPCGYAASVLRGEALGVFDSDVAFNDDEGIFRLLAETEQARQRDLSLDAFKAMQPVERMAWAWVLSNEKALADSAGLTNILPVRYEDVCENPIDQARKMFAFAGLDWHRQTEQFLTQSISTEKNDYYSVYKNPAKSVNKWKDYLHSEQIDAILKIVQSSTLKTYYAA